MNSSNKTFVAVVLMTALAFAIAGVSSFAAPVFAQGKPSNVPPSPELVQQTGPCAASGHGPGVTGCHFVPDVR